MKSQLKDKMLEAIFVKTGGRPENPTIAEICAEIATEHFSLETKDESGVSIEKTISIEVSPPAGGEVKRVLLQWHSLAGGWMFQFWVGGGFMGDLIYARTRNMVFSSPFGFMEVQPMIPAEEYFQGSESDMVKMVSGLTEADFNEMIGKYRRAVERSRENPLNLLRGMKGLPYVILLDLFSEKESANQQQS
jgi:hypothetical protein